MSLGPLDLSPDKSQDAKSSGGATGKDVSASAGSLPAIPLLLGSQVHAGDVSSGQAKAEMVTQSQFTVLQDRVIKLENASTGGPDVKALPLQLDRLDPAKRSLAMHGLTDINLDTRPNKLVRKRKTLKVL